MSALFTDLDAVREYLTGAAADGGNQSDPNKSLGGYRSSTEVVNYGITLANPIYGIAVLYAAGGNQQGTGQINVVDANTIQWQDAANQGFGPPQYIANGQQVILESNNNPGAYLRVVRVSAQGLVNPTVGTMTVTLAPLFNNLFGEEDISSALAGSGVTTYRASILRAECQQPINNFVRCLAQLGTSQISTVTQLGGSGSGTIATSGSFIDWPLTGYCRIETHDNNLREIVYYSSRNNTTLTVPSTGRALLGSSSSAGTNMDNLYAVPGIAFGIDSAGVQSSGSSIQQIGNDTTAPSGITWCTGIRAAQGITITSLAGQAAQLVGFWLKRQIPANAYAAANCLVKFVDSFQWQPNKN